MKIKLKKSIITAINQHPRILSLAISFGIMSIMFMIGTMMDQTAHAVIAQGPGCGSHRLCCSGNYNYC